MHFGINSASGGDKFPKARFKKRLLRFMETDNVQLIKTLFNNRKIVLPNPGAGKCCLLHRIQVPGVQDESLNKVFCVDGQRGEKQRHKRIALFNFILLSFSYSVNEVTFEVAS